MPGLRPTRPDPDEEPEGDGIAELPFHYMVMSRKTPQGDMTIHAMTFEQIIDWLTHIERVVDEDESPHFHFDQIKRILRKYLDGK